MLFNSFEFLWLFPIIFCLYYAITYRDKFLIKCPKLGNYFLIAISYALYIKWNPVYVLILLGVTCITYFAAIKIENDKAYGRKKYIIYTGVCLTLLPLLVFKYYNFLSDTFEHLANSLGVDLGLPGLNWVMPLGISFYTFQALGYLVDVYLKRF